MFRWLGRLPLRVLLTAPFLLLVVGLAAALAAISVQTGQAAVDKWAGQLMVETVYRISRTVERHVGASAVVLETAFPDGTVAPAPIASELGALRTRFWLATSVARNPNNYAYYGDRDGHFFGLWRHSQREAELRLRTAGQGPRSVRRFTGIDGPLGAPVIEARVFEPRERPWYRVGLSAPEGAWSPIYIDFKTGELVVTRVRPVQARDGSVAGVVATDLSLQAMSDLMQSVRLPPQGVAMIVERDGGLIGLSRGSPVQRGEDDRPVRVLATDSSDSLVVAAYAALRDDIDRQPWDGGGASGRPRTMQMSLADGELAQVAYERVRDAAGLDWVTAVVVPRASLLQDVQDGFRSSLWVAAAASVAAIVLGLLILATIRRELAGLAGAAHRIGAGEGNPAFDTRRGDEIGDLGRSLAEMQARLLTDTLTGLSNREAALRRLGERIGQGRRRSDVQRFALLFVDFDRFKQINDRFGHDVGDRVLQEMAQRLAGRVRTQDLVARYAGDEFLVVLDAMAQRADAHLVRQNLERAMREPLASLAALGAGDFPHGASIGLAMHPDDGQDVDTLIRVADADMYRRKSAGDEQAQ